MKKNYSLVLICSGTIFFGNISFAQEQPRVLGTDDNFIQKMKADGLSDAVIEKIIKQRKEMMQKGKNVLWTNLKNAQLPVPSAICDDIGVENGWGAWDGAPGTSGPPAFSAPSNPPPAPNGNTGFYLNDAASGDVPCTPGTNPGDPTVPKLAQGFGNYSIGLGEPQTPYCYAEQITYPITVTTKDTNFLFTYAMLMEDPGHDSANQPFFNVMMLDQSGNTIPNSYFIYVSGPNMPGFYQADLACSFGATYYKPWTLRGVNLSPYIGQTVTFVATNVDCGYCGHFAQGFADFDCDGILYSPRYCPGGPVTLDARSEPNSQYLWEDGSTTAAITLSTPTAGDTVSCTVTPWGGYTFKASYILTPAQAIFSSTINTNTVTFTNTSDVSVSCFWNFGDGNTSTTCNPVHVYSSPGTYTVCLTIQTDACNGTTSCSTVTILSTGINEQNLQSSIAIMPNPASEMITVDVKNIFLPQTIEATVYNLIGTEMSLHSLSQQQGKYKMNISSLPVGVYFVKLVIDNKEITKKIVVSREK